MITPYPRLRTAYFHSRKRIPLVVLCASSLALAQPKSPPNVVSLDWNKATIVSKSTPTLQVVDNPMLRSGAPTHDGALQALKQGIDVMGESQLVVEATLSSNSDIAAQGFITPAGKKLLLVNKRKRIIDVTLPDGAHNANLSTVDEASGEGAARASEQQGTHLDLAVVVLSFQ